MKLALAILLVCLSSAEAAKKDWTKSFWNEGCGDLEKRARMVARTAAEEEAAEYTSECEEDAGDAASKFISGYCDHDGMNFECRVRCSVYGKVTCTF